MSPRMDGQNYGCQTARQYWAGKVAGEFVKFIVAVCSVLVLTEIQVTRLVER